MKKEKIVFLLFTIISLGLCVACQNDKDPIYDSELDEAFNDTTLVSIEEETIPNLTIREGIISQHEETIRILRNCVAEAIVHLEEPIIVSQANREENWGFFQFPMLFRDTSGSLIVSWQMNEDSYTAYGKEAAGSLMSLNGGLTWEELDSYYFPRKRNRVEFSNGDFLQVHNPIAKDISQYLSFPSPAYSEAIKGYQFYYETEVPVDLKGVYLEHWKNDIKDTVVFHGSINDPGLLRYTIDGHMPIIWWGDIKELSNKNLIAGVYGGNYLNPDGKPLRSAVTFYQSSDRGNLWKRVGIIPYQPNQESDYNSFVFDGVDGFTEPAFEILRDGTIFCVMRSGNDTPMYKSFSYDNGYHWSIPEPFTPNGVMPRLLRLKNGVLVLSSGRPGVQIRFCIEGNGSKWTEPVEMMPFMQNGIYNKWSDTCGYTTIIPAENGVSFYIVYSDFKTKDSNGEMRKAIIFRKVSVHLKG